RRRDCRRAHVWPPSPAAPCVLGAAHVQPRSQEGRRQQQIWPKGLGLPAHVADVLPGDMSPGRKREMLSTCTHRGRLLSRITDGRRRPVRVLLVFCLLAFLLTEAAKMRLKCLLASLFLLAGFGITGSHLRLVRFQLS